MRPKVTETSYSVPAWWSLALVVCLAVVRLIDFFGVLSRPDKLVSGPSAKQPPISAAASVPAGGVSRDEVSAEVAAMQETSVANGDGNRPSNNTAPPRSEEIPAVDFARAQPDLKQDNTTLAAIPWIDPEAQLFIYELNLARHDPQTYALSLPIKLDEVAPRPPLAINHRLVESAQFHAREMAEHDYVDHQSQVTRDWPNKLARDQGYRLPVRFLDDSNQIESIAAGYEAAKATVDQLVVDEGIASLGHRKHLLGIDSENAANREIGVGYAGAAETTYRHYWAIHSTRNDAPGPLLTGVVFNDENQNGRYDLNEGLPGVTISTGEVQTHSNSAGGWSIPAQPGTNHVLAVLPLGQIEVDANVVDNDNLEVDFSNGVGGVVNFEN